MTYKVQIDDTVRDATPEEAAAIEAANEAAAAQAAADAEKQQHAPAHSPNLRRSASTTMRLRHWWADEVAARLRGLVQGIRRWKRRRAYHKRIRSNKRAKSRARSRTATDLRMGQHERP